MEEVVDRLRQLGRHARHGGEIGERGAADGLCRAEMRQQGALPRRADALDLVERVLRQGRLAPGAVRADGEAVRLVAQPLYELEHRIARLQHEGLAAGDEELLAAGVAVRPLGDADQRDIVLKAEFLENAARGG